MKVYLIAWQGRSTWNFNYTDFHNLVKDYSENWYILMDNMYYITVKDTDDILHITRELRQKLYKDDSLLVQEITTDCKVNGFLPSKFWKWYEENNI